MDDQTCAVDDYDAWGSLRLIHTVMSNNSEELLGLLRELNDNTALVIGLTQTDMVSLFETVTRLAHNYLSARQMLIDHTRNTLRAFQENRVVEEYRARVKEVTSHPEGPVLQRLRNYLLHYRVPPFEVQMALASPPTLSLHLQRDRMLTFDDWTMPARVFIESQGPKIPLRPLIEEDLSRLQDLYRWLFSQLGAMHPYQI